MSVYKVRVRYRRVSLAKTTVGETPSKKKAHEWAQNLRVALAESPNARGEFKVFVVKKVKKGKKK